MTKKEMDDFLKEIEDNLPEQFKKFLKEQSEENDNFDPNVICPLKRSNKIKKFIRIKKEE